MTSEVFLFSRASIPSLVQVQASLEQVPRLHSRLLMAFDVCFLAFDNMKSRDVLMKVKGAIMRLRNRKHSLRRGRTSDVWNIIKKKESNGELSKQKGTGRPRKTSTVDDGRILTIRKKSPQTPVEAGVDVSVTTVSKRHKLQRLHCKMPSTS